MTTVLYITLVQSVLTRYGPFQLFTYHHYIRMISHICNKALTSFNKSVQVLIKYID